MVRVPLCALMLVTPSLAEGWTGGSSERSLLVRPYRPAPEAWKRTQCGHPNGTADLPTKYGLEVSASATPLPEYPRPRMVRGSASMGGLTALRDYGDPQSWQNLNGLWEWEPIMCTVPRVHCPGMDPPLLCCPEGNYSTAPPFGKELAKQILVPFPQESCLSGVAPQSTEDVAMRSWYRLTFDASPALIAGSGKTLLHFGAVDWHALVYVNGQLVANHTGGFDGFSADITSALRLRKGSQGDVGEQQQQEQQEAQHELLVYAFDPSESGPQPHGKQRMGVLSNPGELWTIVYTSTTGIWQTVWLENVPAKHITDVQVRQSLTSLDTVHITVTAAPISQGNDHAAFVTITALDGNMTVGTASGAEGEALTLRIANAVLWDPAQATPKLYDLRVALSSGDVVMSYVGLRSWSIPTPGYSTAPDGPLLVGVDLGGRDIIATSVSTRDACHALCIANSSCLAFVYSNCSTSNISSSSSSSSSSSPAKAPATNCWLKSGPLAEYPCTDAMRASNEAHGGFSINCAGTGNPCHTSQRVAYRSSTRPSFNGHSRFFAGVLDQSWWPDGQYVAPTDEALASDLEATKAMGFEMLRLHQKVNPERWYYHADRIGVAVFQDMPQKYLSQGRTNMTVVYYIDDLKAMVAGRGSHPCILQWTAFNEGDCWRIFTEDNPQNGIGIGGVAALFKQLDPGRLLDLASGDPGGGSCPGPSCPMGGQPTPMQSLALNESGDVADVHTYPIPGDPRPDDGRAHFGSRGQRYGMVGEYSGLGATPSAKQYLPGQCQHQNWCNCIENGTRVPCFGCAANMTSELALSYVALAQVLQLRAASGDISASVMTQLTDIELECDGFLNYDRTTKFTPAELRQIHDAHRKIVAPEH